MKDGIIRAGFCNIRVVGNGATDRHQYSDLMKVEPGCIEVLHPSQYLLDLSRPGFDLLLIDIDACSSDEIGYLVFITAVFSPTSPIVLITRKSLPERMRQWYLQSLRILDIVELTDNNVALAV